MSGLQFFQSLSASTRGSIRTVCWTDCPKTTIVRRARGNCHWRRQRSAGFTRSQPIPPPSGVKVEQQYMVWMNTEEWKTGKLRRSTEASLRGYKDSVYPCSLVPKTERLLLVIIGIIKS
ncbi:uncharacterized protein LOC129289107 isoform X2 [Prosopis cineraria]|uniref:uncharacterized protein LOC129289107 isoform X2 n=1 Tax=Prosopis cineraria TaxID=364024 RepID=UPI00240EAB64|nr:uncharacterized protein LOC129289107 isoform X2 [Prosopis cineraria]